MEPLAFVSRDPQFALTELGVFAALCITLILALKVVIEGDAASLFRRRAEVNERRGFSDCAELDEPDLEPPAPDFTP